MGVQTGHPLVMRGQNSAFTIANFMRMNIMAAFGALAAGNEALRAQDVKIDKLYGHGGIFKTPKVAQSLLAAALEAPVTVMATAGEGGAWGQAVAASYMVHKAEDEALDAYLNDKVFANMEGTTHADYFYGPVPCMRGLTETEIEEAYELNTGKVIVEGFTGGTGQASIDPVAVPGCLVRNHGPFSWGKDAAAAVYHAVVLEEVAKMAAHTEMLKPAVEPAPQYLLDKHYLRKHGPNAYYGQGNH